MTKKKKTCIEPDCTNPPLGWSNPSWPKSGDYRQRCDVHHDLEQLYKTDPFRAEVRQQRLANENTR